MNKINEIVELWFDQSGESKCQQLYPACNGCPFCFQANPEKEDMACKTIWLLIEKAAKNI
jgi:hypothetical protein